MQGPDAGEPALLLAPRSSLIARLRLPTALTAFFLPPPAAGARCPQSRAAWPRGGSAASAPRCATRPGFHSSTSFTFLPDEPLASCRGGCRHATSSRNIPPDAAQARALPSDSFTAARRPRLRTPTAARDAIRSGAFRPLARQAGRGYAHLVVRLGAGRHDRPAVHRHRNIRVRRRPRACVASIGVARAGSMARCPPRPTLEFQVGDFRKFAAAVATRRAVRSRVQVATARCRLKPPDPRGQGDPVNDRRSCSKSGDRPVQSEPKWRAP